MLLTAVWVYWPMLRTLQLSFYEWNLLPTRDPVWLGLSNYAQLLRQPEVSRAVLNSALYIVGLVPFTICIPVVLALALGRVRAPAERVYRALMFLPVLMAPVVSAIVWRWIMNPNAGILNALLQSVGIGPVDWFRTPNVALWAITVITGWKLLGFSTLIVWAGLTNINREYLEAAVIDGATSWQRLRFVIAPLLSPTLVFMLLLTVLLSGQLTFPIINALTQGGPRDTTTNIYYLLWQFGFESFNVGLSSAAGVLFFGGFLILAVGLMRLVDRLSFHDA
ncbi:MAG: sugar ABC transporter permease [Chloroflexi bacterium]|nr:sugar ABC transporter permease [Chloroflexota bacterium]MBV9896179.1 sugar ABC transporter permease [Chloroflexota bacterium]